MKVKWFGQSAFHFHESGGSTVFVDPFAHDVEAAAASRGMRFAYPPIDVEPPDVLLVSHEHFDHNGVSAVGQVDVVIRSTAGSFDTPAGQVIAIAAEHDDVAGTARGPVALFVFTLGDTRVCHLSDLGQKGLRPEQVAAIGAVDLLFVPVGGGFTIGADVAAAVTAQLAPTWVVPMHYRTPALDFLEPPDEFLAAFPERDVHRLEGSVFETGELPRGDAPLVVVPAPPSA